jgi:hypothetical protein
MPSSPVPHPLPSGLGREKLSPPANIYCYSCYPVPPTPHLCNYGVLTEQGAAQLGVDSVFSAMFGPSTAARHAQF